MLDVSGIITSSEDVGTDVVLQLAAVAKSVELEPSQVTTAIH